MPIKQITVFLENKAGRLSEVTDILRGEDINLQGFSTTEARDYGILRIVVSDVEKSISALKQAGFTTHVADVICVEVLDKPGELANILDIMANDNINIDYIYVIANTRIVLCVENINEAEEVLAKNNIKLCD